MPGGKKKALARPPAVCGVGRRPRPPATRASCPDLGRASLKRIGATAEDEGAQTTSRHGIEGPMK